jgi:acetoin utilization deacetylase AcuC-like enzyme
MTRRRLFYTDHHEIPLPPGHRFPIRKYRLIREMLEREHLFDFEPAPLATREKIELAHEPGYVAAFFEGTLAPREMRRIGFPWSMGLVNRTLASVGATIAASHDALRSGVGGTLAGGTHHAFPDYGSGFCVFNDIAVAIFSLRATRSLKRAAVVDLDVHQGDGTAAIFENDPNVLTVSLHGENNFPFRKQVSKIDVGLPDRTEDAPYLTAVERVLPRVAEFGPEIVFYQSGVDALASDTLGRLSLTHQGLVARDRAVLTFCRDRTLPVVITLGGGYADPIEDTALAHANTFRTAAAVFGSELSEERAAS